MAAWHRRSAICALIEFVAGGIALLAFVQWVFDPTGPNTSRWLLLVLILVYAAVHVRLRESWPRHAVQAVNAAGLAAIVLAISYLGGGLPFRSGSLAGARPGRGGSSFSSPSVSPWSPTPPSTASPVPDTSAFVVLVLFVALAGQPSATGASLIGWPILLLIVGGAGVAAGLRPRRDLPPGAGFSRGLHRRPGR